MTESLSPKGTECAIWYDWSLRFGDSNSIWGKIRSVNSVSGEKLHDFEIICPAESAFLPLYVRAQWFFVSQNHFCLKPLN